MSVYIHIDMCVRPSIRRYVFNASLNKIDPSFLLRPYIFRVSFDSEYSLGRWDV